MNEKVQKISKFLVCLILLVLVSGLIQYFIENEANAAAYSTYDINGIDENKYPGYKSALKKLQEEHPNWKFKLYYTGLDWQTVINNEYVGHGGSPKSLIYDTYNEEWICPTCGTRKYDLSQRWYCASQEAIKYMMDPRNSLTEDYIFQFQDLSSSIGDRDAVKKMTEGTFLYNDSYIDAIMKSAKDNNVSPFHIVSRIIQEQGNDGKGVYAKGIEYNGRIVYNLFNIGATGGAGEYENGAKKAYDEGWFSVESSIQGGTKFIKTNYINRGQVSLYFQKYNVVEEGNLYNHQYMQNIGAARSEGLTTYNGYKKNGIENSSFEFIIPIYRNMPYYASYRPNESYMGQINTALNSMNLIESNGRKFISGEIDIAEWINDTCYTPKGTPTIYLKSTDGTFSKKLFSYYKQGLTYYYDTAIDTLDITKKYYIEVQLNSPRNAGTQEMKTQRVIFENKELGPYGNGIVKTQDNLLKFTYMGTINTVVNDIKLIQNNGKTYVSGTVDVEEKIAGKSYIPGELPELKLKSTEGTFSKNMFRYHQEGLTYYFDTAIDELDVTKQYYIEVKLINQDNIASENQKTQRFIYENKDLGVTTNGDYIRWEDNKIKFTYKGIIETELQDIYLNDNGQGKHYISGNIEIKENLNNISFVPSTLPELTLKTAEGYRQKMYIHHSGNGNYYFDTYIEDLDATKKYYIEARLSNVNNIASEEEKAKKVELEDRQLGKIKENKVYIKDSYIQFIDANLYRGIIKTNLQNIGMNANQEDKHYIYGNVQIQEIIEGKANVPSTLPELTLKSTDGYSQKMYIYHSGNGNYYFDTYIEEIDKEKQYWMEARLTNPKNMASESEKEENVIMTNKILGKIKDKNAIIQDSKLQFTEGEKYKGQINTKLTDGIYLKDNGAGRHYISGNVKIIEIINGEESISTVLPSLTLKSDEGYNQKMYIYHAGNGNYYFDTYIEDLNTENQYYIEAKLTNQKNTANESEKVQKVVLGQKELGIVKGLKVVTKNTDIQFKDGDKYQGEISTKLVEGIYLRDNGMGRHYICGNIQIKEIIDGKVNIPNTLPSLTLKSANEYSQKMYIYHAGNGNYYFDTYIEDLDSDEEYYIEASLTSPNNTSAKKAETVTLKNVELGNIKQDSILVSIKDNKFIFTKIQLEEKNVEMQLDEIQEEEKIIRKLQQINMDDEKEE